MSEGELPYVILVVEDDPDHAALIRAVFAKLDPMAYVQVARSAEEAITYLVGPWPDSDVSEGELPDVIVLDVMMPGLGGVGFMEWYAGRRRVKEVPVVVFTASEDPELERRCLELGAREYKEKPADFGELVEVVHRALQKWRPKRDRGRGAEGA